MASFKVSQLKAQLTWLASPQGASARAFGPLEAGVFLGHESANLFPPIQTEIEAYLIANHIQRHRMSRHVLSSQVCCFNFLFSFAHRPEALAGLLKPLFHPSDVIEMVPFEEEKPTANDWYVAFEWTGDPGKNYLNEKPVGGRLQRGAHSTSVDAAVKVRRSGQVETILIEWKYTESYSCARSERSRRGDPTRLKRYDLITFSDLIDSHGRHGPIQRERGLETQNLFYEPFYQMLRQQLLASQMESVEGERVSVLHLAPRGNTALRERVTAPALKGQESDVFAVWKRLLSAPYKDRFSSVSIEDLFGRFDASAHGMEDWRAYVGERYAFGFPTAPPTTSV